MMILLKRSIVVFSIYSLFFFMICAFFNLNCSRIPSGYNVELKLESGQENFIEKVKNFELNSINRKKLNVHQRQLLEVIDLIRTYQLQVASAFVKKILNSEPNHTYSLLLSQILIYILFETSNWLELTKYTNSNWFADPDSVFLLARAFAKAKQDSIFFDGDRDSIQISFTPSGTPIIPVKINGKTRFFWFDTGTNYTVISSDIADECNVQSLVKERTKALSASNYKIDATPAIIKKFEIVNLKILNHPAIIVDSSYLKMRLFGSNRISKIDGIIGWKAIQYARFTINPFRKNIQIENPKLFQNSLTTNENNFFWFGFPIVIAYFSQRPLLYILDLGSERSILTFEIFNKIDFSQYYQQIKIQGSVGGWRYLPTAVVPYLKITISNSEVEFFNIHTNELKKDCFFSIDGYLGADLLQQASITFDVQNSSFFINRGR